VSVKWTYTTTDTYSMAVNGRSCAPVELSARYTTADIVLEIGSTSAAVEQVSSVQKFVM